MGDDFIFYLIELKSFNLELSVRVLRKWIASATIRDEIRIFVKWGETICGMDKKKKESILKKEKLKTIELLSEENQEL